ncbi:glycosyltransferase [bacterium]|nr:glycosyltransferase [bacterium]
MRANSNPQLIGSFPYAPGQNPYQHLITAAIESAGNIVNRIPPSKWLPLQKAISSNCDILHLDWPHDWYNGKNLALRTLKTAMYRWGLKTLKEKPVIWTAHNLVSHDCCNLQREQKMIQLLINQCQGIMVMSDSARDELYQHYRVPSYTEVRKIYHGHYIDCYKNELSREEARKKLSIEQSAFVYLSIGSIQPYKGHRELIDVFSEISKPEDVLMIAGGGNKHFLKQVQDQIKSSSGQGKIKLIPRFIPDDELQFFFNAADVSVFPFKKVLNSGSIMLAMGFGSPIVAPRLGSIPEVVIPSHYYGYSPLNESLEGLKTALKNAKRETHGNRKFEKTKRELIDCVRRRYDWSKIGIELSNWYREIT